MSRQTNIAQSLTNIALDVSGVDISTLKIPITHHFASTNRTNYYISQVQKIQISRAIAKK